MQFVCKNCFADKELVGFITSQNTIGNCDCCRSQEVEIIPIEELHDFFKELIENFQANPRGERLISKIQGNWSLFSNLGNGQNILNYILNNIDSTLNSYNDLVDFNDEIIENINYWFKLKEQLKWEKRYLTDIDYLTEGELGWDGFFGSKTTIKNDDILYRARLHKNADEGAFSKDNMFSPKREFASGGRANPNGIPYLYLSDRPDTILYEVRASYLDEVSIASFRLKEDLSDDIVISDFTETPALYAPSGVNQRIKATLLKQFISRDLSKPMRRYDSELDYIPTQFICEFIKVFTNVQGIKFRSSLHNIGNNIVIFNQDIMECEAVKRVQVSKVSIDSKEL